jgi:hypothetical protein
MSLPLIAIPTSDPIKIDAGAFYYYVIPHEGATSATIDTDADFFLGLTFGSPAILQLKYKSAVPTTPVFKSLVVHFTNDEGTTSQTLNFKVGDNSTRRIPNIISVPSSKVAPSGDVNFPIYTDLSNTKVYALGLPPDLSVSGSNISGQAPSIAGTYVIQLGAHLAGESNDYIRYWVLNVASAVAGGGIGGGSDFTSTPPSGGARILYDGDYTVAQQAGASVPVTPIPEDPKPYIYRIRYWQFLDNYRQPDPGSAGPNGGYYVGEVPGSFHDIAAGVVEFVREFAFVPDSRNEFESYTYSYQYWQTQNNSSSVTEVPITTLSRVQYDYFHLSSVPDQLATLQAPDGAGGGAPKTTSGSGGWGGRSGPIGGGNWISGSGTNAGGTISSIDLPKAPRVFQIFNAIYFTNGYGSLVNGEEILAEDATIKQWRGLIYERKQRFVVFINPA